MEDEINNQEETKRAIGASAEEGQGPEKQIDPEKDVLIHNMPKRFLKSASSAQNTKKVGVLILIGGGLLLVAGLVFVYYYFVYSKNPISAIKEEAPNAPWPASQTQEKPDLSEQAEGLKQAEKIPEDGPVEIATTSIAEKNESRPAATSSPETATGSARIIQVSTTTRQIEYKKALDSDGDGLADLEEILFDCNIDSKDSDGDGYDDLSEILNLYNPAGSGSLMVNPNIEKYINSRYGYSVYYPYVWQVDNLGGDESIIFKADNNQFVQIIVQENPNKALLDDWYLDQMKLDEIESDRKIYKKGWQAIKSNDDLTIYLAKPGEDKIYVLSYNLGAGNTLYFINVFNMMMKSFEVD